MKMRRLPASIDLKVVPLTRPICTHHQPLVTRSGIPMDKGDATVERYGNMSAATVPVALSAKTVEQGQMKPGR